MFFMDLILALVVAMVFSTIIFTVGRTAPGPATGFLFFVLILFLTTWAGGIWMPPMGPVLWGASWLNFLLVGLVVFLILMAVTPPRPSRVAPPPEGEGVSGTELAVTATFSVFFWVLAVILLVVILIRYF